MDNDDRRPNILSRRELLALMGAGAVVVAVGCGDDDGGESAATDTPGASATGTPGTTSTAPTATIAATATEVPVVSCVVTPELTEGPYFVDEMLLRSDITADPTTGEIRDGVPLTLDLVVYTVSNGACTPLEGAAVDIWHCDALGEYSDISGGAGQSDTSGQKFLRGYQVTGGGGAVRFITIYPGWYSGRTIHIHFKVRTDPDADQGLQFTSQLFFDEAINDDVVARDPYRQKGIPDTRNADDNIYLDEMLVPLVASGDGYVGSYSVGIADS